MDKPGKLFTGDLASMVADKSVLKIDKKPTTQKAEATKKTEKEIKTPEPKVEKVIVEEKKKSKKAFKILVADDEKPLAKALQLKLSSEGFEVETVFNGEEALDSINKNSFDLILLDLVMPKLDGFGVLTKLRADGKKVPVIVTSNLSQPEDIKRAKEDLGAIEFFIKSNTPIKEIISFVTNYLNK